MKAGIFQNRLIQKLTDWPGYYAIIPIVAMLLASVVFTVLSMVWSLELLTIVSPILMVLLLALISLGTVRLLSGKFPSSDDMGFHKEVLTRRNVIIILAVFLLTHAFFYLAGKVGGVHTDAQQMFRESGFGMSFWYDLMTIIGVTLMAPVVEELVYRGIMLRALHDSLQRRFPGSTSILSIPALASLSITAVALSYLMSLK